MGKAQPMVSGAIPGLVVLGSIRKQAEQVGEASQKAAPHSGLCISSCLQDPALTASDNELLCGTVNEINPSPGNLLLVMMFHHNNSNPL